MPEIHAGRLVARNFLALGSGEVVARAVAFLATIYLARTLGPASYGMIGFAMAVMLYLSRVADFGIELSGTRELAQDTTRLHGLAPAVLTIRLLIAVALVAGAWLIALLAPGPESALVAAYSLTLFAVAGGTRWVVLGMERAKAIAVTRTLGELVMAGLVVALVRGPADVLRAPAAQILGDTVAALLLAIWLRRQGFTFSLSFEWGAARPLFKRAAPLVVSALLGLIIYNSDLIFLRVFSGTRAVGIYAASYALVSLLVNLGLTYRVSLLPTLTRLAADPQRRQDLYAGALAHVFAVAIPLGLGGFLLAPQIIALVFGSAFAAAVPALQLLIWTVPLSLLRDVPTAGLLAAGREDRIFRLTAWGAALNLALNLLLIPRWGLVGAGIATVATEAVRLLIALVYVRAEGFRIARIRLLARVALASAAMVGTLLVVQPRPLWAALLLGIGGYAIALIAVRAVRLRRGQLPALNL